MIELEEEPVSNEVIVIPGRCVTWRCNNPAWPGPECAVCSILRDPCPPELRRDRSAENARYKAKRQNDAAYREAERERKREYMRAKRRANPGYCPGRHPRAA